MGVFILTALGSVFWVIVFLSTSAGAENKVSSKNSSDVINVINIINIINVINASNASDASDVTTTQSNYEYYDYYGGGQTEAPTEPRYFLFSTVMMVSSVLIVVQILATIFIPTLPDSPIRWHTLNCCCWNVFQLLIFANCTAESSLEEFLKNTYITNNCDDIQRMTLSIFLCSIILQIPVVIAQHFVPNLASTKFYRFYVWIPIYFFLDIGIFLVYSSEPWSWRGEEVEIIPIRAFQAGVTVISYFIVAILEISAICGIIHYIVYGCQYLGRPDSQLTSAFVRLINFILFSIYVEAIFFVHTPANGFNMGTFLGTYIYEYILPYIDYFIDIGLKLLEMMSLTTLLIPVVEFFATWFLIPQYRNQLLICCSCGLALSKPRPITRPVIPFKIENFNKIQSISENTRDPLPVPPTVFPASVQH